MKIKFAILFIIVIGVLLFGLTIRGVPGNLADVQLKGVYDQPTQPLELSPERGRFAHVLALSKTGSYELNQGLADFVYPDVGYYNGKFFSFFAPGISYLALPFYIIGSKFGLGQVASYSLISLASILGAVFLFLISKQILKLPTWASLTAVVIFLFGSTAWGYATTMYQHHLTVLFILASFYATWKFRKKGKYSGLYALIVGACYSLAIFIDYPNALLLLPVMIYFALSCFDLKRDDGNYKFSMRPAILSAGIIFLLITSLHLYHNKIYFGSWTRLSGSIIGYKDLKEKNLLDKSTAVVKEEINKIQTKKDNVVHFFSEQEIPNSPGTLLFSKDRGLFFFMPIFLLAILGWARLLRTRKSLETIVLVSLILVNLFLYSSWADPWGGWAFGPRYLIPSMSILSIGVAAFVAENKRWWKSSLVFLMFLYSSAIALLGALTSNAVPPKVEADQLHSAYNFMFDLRWIKQDQSSSFVFNSYLHNHISLINYFFVIYILVVLIMIAVLFIFPKFEEKKDV